jgi:hypothetical protein
VTGPAHDFVPAEYDPDDIGYWIDESARLAVQNIVDVDIPLLEVPVSDAEIRSAGIDDLEVHRAPQMGNPSWLSKEDLTRLAPMLPKWPALGRPGKQITVSAAGAGFGDPEQNALVEAAAMAAVRRYYRGWEADDVSMDKVGWDITFTHRASAAVAHVEVKGVSGNAPVVLLTANEVRAAEERPNWHLAVVTRALSDPTVVEYPAEVALGLSRPYVYRADLRGAE